MTNYQIANAMITYGGSFVAALGKAIHLADPINQAKLQAAFPEYFTQYAELAALQQAQRSA